MTPKVNNSIILEESFYYKLNQLKSEISSKIGLESTEIEAPFSVMDPKEQEFCSHFKSAKRRIDFATGRKCAHKLLKDFGYPDFPILNDEWGSVIWPENIQGSISHGKDFWTAAITNNQNIYGLGVDVQKWDISVPLNSPEQDANALAERRGGLEERIASRILHPLELKLVSHMDEEDRIQCIRNLFSLKECVYKCFNPLLHEYIAFKDVRLLHADESEAFEFEWVNSKFKKIFASYQVEFKYLADKNYVFALMWITKN